MKKRSLTGLALNKTSISNLETHTGGAADLSSNCSIVTPSRLASRCEHVTNCECFTRIDFCSYTKQDESYCYE